MTYIGLRVAMNSLLHRRAAAVAFSFIMACVLGLAGLLGSGYLWGHFGPPAADPDDIEGYFFSLFVGGLLAACGILGSLWMFWPRVRKRA